MASSRMTVALISSRTALASCPSRSYDLSLFQDKLTVVRDSLDSVGQCDRPQSVTRHLFAPLATAVPQLEQQQQEQPQLSCRPQTATASIFAPRTEDMNKGFLTFSEDQPGLTSVYSPLYEKENRILSKVKARKENRGFSIVDFLREKKELEENDKER